MALDTARQGDSSRDKTENTLGRDGVVLHPRDLADLYYAPGPVTEAVQVDQDVESACDLLPHCLDRELDPAHQNHRLDPAEGVPGLVGVDGCHRTLVAGVHRLEHVECLWAAHLADYDPVRAHSQGRDDQISVRDLLPAVGIRVA